MDVPDWGIAGWCYHLTGCGALNEPCCAGGTCNTGLVCCGDGIRHESCPRATCNVACNVDSDCGVCSDTWTNEGCTGDKCCNRDYGGSGKGKCVSIGTIYNNQYLCAS